MALGIELFEKEFEFLGAGDEILCRQQYWVVAQVRAHSAVECCGAHGSVLAELPVASVETFCCQVSVLFPIGFRAPQPLQVVHGVDGVGDGEGIAVVAVGVGTF